MERAKYSGEDAAKKDLGIPQTKPAWLQNQHSLPFQFLSDDEFEIFCYLLLCRENPEDKIFYYGKTGDAGRDIVRIKQDGSVELIQCKRYQNNVDVGKIRAEIAKLYVNLHNGIIAEKPNRVTFYVVPDLTPSAQDLISHNSKWIKIAGNALKVHLKKEPNKELLDFVLSWYPGFSKEAAIDLTQRAWQHKNLIEEFFEYRKVIDSATVEPKLDEMLDLLKQIHEGRGIPLQPNIANAPSSFQNLLHKAEEENPGIAFAVTLDAEKIVFDAKAKANPVSFGTLAFPNSEAGERGKQKFFQMAIEEGRAIELEAGEYEWKWDFKLPEIGEEPLTLKTLSFCPRIPEIRVPIRIEILQNTELVASVNFTYLHLVRAGTREMEFLIEGGQLRGKITFISYLQDKKISLTFGGVDLCTVTAAQAKETIAIILALYQGAELRVTSLENDAVLFEETGVVNHCNTSEKDLKNTVKFLDCLLKINREFDLDLRYPKTLEPETVETAAAIVNAIKEGRIEHPSGILRLTYRRQEALKIVESLKTEGSFDLTMDIENDDHQLLGHVLPTGKSRVIFENIFLVEDVGVLKQAIQTLAELEEIQIALQYNRAIQTFLEWLPKATNEQTEPAR